MSNEQTLVNQALEAYAAAVHAKDVDAFAALYNDNVHIYDSWGQWQYTGIESWRSMAAEWFSSPGDERVQVEFNDVQYLRELRRNPRKLEK